MKLRIEIREEDSGQVLAIYHKRWYGGSDFIFSETIRLITEGMVPRFRAFQKALDQFHPLPKTHLDMVGPSDGKGKITFTEKPKP